MRYQRFWSGCLVLCLVVTWCGCGPGNPLGRRAISGSVTLDGAPLDQGSIQFSPQQQQGGVGSGAVISNGGYTIAADKGLPPGKYLVRIFSAEQPDVPVPKGPPGSVPIPPATERIPPEYNANSDKIVEVTAAGSNQFDFDIRTE